MSGKGKKGKGRARQKAPEDFTLEEAWAVLEEARRNAAAQIVRRARELGGGTSPTERLGWDSRWIEDTLRDFLIGCHFERSFGALRVNPKSALRVELQKAARNAATVLSQLAQDEGWCEEAMQDTFTASEKKRLKRIYVKTFKDHLRNAAEKRAIEEAQKHAGEALAEAHTCWAVDTTRGKPDAARHFVLPTSKLDGEG